MRLIDTKEYGGGVKEGLKTWRMSFAEPEDLPEVKQLDDLVFAGQQGISLEELRAIIDHGAIIMLHNGRDEMGHSQLIGESQVLTSAIPPYLNDLPDHLGFCYGTGIHPDHQNHHLSQALIQMQEKVVRDAGKKGMLMTVRQENAKSIRARLHAGFYVVSYDPTHYGPTEEGGARLYMAKDFQNPHNHPRWMQMAESALAEGALPVFNGAEEQASIIGGADMFGLPVRVGEAVDIFAHTHLKRIFDSRYKGVAFLKPDEHKIKNYPDRSMMIFSK